MRVPILCGCSMRISKTVNMELPVMRSILDPTNQGVIPRMALGCMKGYEQRAIPTPGREIWFCVKERGFNIPLMRSDDLWCHYRQSDDGVGALCASAHCLRSTTVVRSVRFDQGDAHRQRRCIVSVVVQGAVVVMPSLIPSHGAWRQERDMHDKVVRIDK